MSLTVSPTTHRSSRASGPTAAPAPAVTPAWVPGLREVHGVRYAVAHGWLVLSVLVAHGIGLPGPLVLVLAVATVVLAARGLPVPWGLGLGVATWAVWTGFVEHRFGLLTFAPDDLLRLAVVLGVCASARAWRR